MITLSAAQAISPAIERTKQFLFRPFRLGTFLKLTLVAMLTEGGLASCNFGRNIPSGNTPGLNHPIPPMHWPQIHWPVVAIVLAVAAVVALVVIPIMIAISYLLIRLRFSYFDCVLHQQRLIAPAWRRYHRQSMRYLGLTLCVSVAFWIVLAAIAYGLYQRFKPLFQAIGSDHAPGFADFLPLIGIVLLIALALGLIAYFIHTALSYFVLPHMALEDASISDALGDVWGDILAEPWQYLFFVLLRGLLTIAVSIVTVIALMIATLILGGIGLVVVLLLKAVSTTLAISLGVPAAILGAALFLVAIVAIGGTIGTFRRNYALLFYGGRYPPLGVILAPRLPPPPPAWEPPQQPGTSGTPGIAEGI